MNDFLTQWQPVKMQSLDDLTRGAVILGIETIDDPTTDGLLIYLQPPAGPAFVLEIDIDAEETDPGEWEEFLTAQKAVLR